MSAQTEYVFIRRERNKQRTCGEDDGFKKE